MDLLQEFSRIDRNVRESEKALHSLAAQLESQKKREQEIYANLGVAGYEDLQAKVVSLKNEVGKKLEEWNGRVVKVNAVIRDIENRVGV